MNAEEAVGASDSGDWILEPESHAKILPPEAGTLARVLKSSKIPAIIKTYGEADADTIAAQSAYKSRRRQAIVLGAVAALLGAVVLYLSGEAPQKSPLKALAEIVRYPALVAQNLALAGARFR